MKKTRLILTVLIMFGMQSVYSQNTDNFSTDIFGIYTEFSDCSVRQLSGNIHYQPIRNPGIHLFYKYSYYFNKNNAFAGTVSCGMNFLKETISIPASDYNLEYDFWDSRNIFIPDLSLSLSYSRLFLIGKDKLYFASFGAGMVSAFGYIGEQIFSSTKVDSLIIINGVYKYIPSPVINLEFGRKIELKNGNFLNLSLYSQLSFSEKLIINHNFFINNPQYTSNAQIFTKLSFIGLKFSYEIRQKE